MVELTERITGYLAYLNQTFQEPISVHFSQEVFSQFPQEVVVRLLPYNTHLLAYCTCVKIDKNQKELCLQEQRKVYKNNYSTPVFRECHAGVYEYINPFMYKTETVGFICVSGHRLEHTERTVYDRDLWSNLSLMGFPKTLINIMLFPLRLMLEELIAATAGRERSEINAIVNYLTEMQGKAGIHEICSHFHRSRSHISHLFKKKWGCSINEYCNQLKLDNAKKLLVDSDKAVTEIALDCGFNDTSYFIKLFKAREGSSPLQFRKQHTKNRIQ